MRVIRIDVTTGLFIEDLPHYDGEITEDIVETICPEGFCLPKWTGTEWIEGLTQAEIEALNNVIHEPTEEEKLQAQINTMQGALDFIILNY